MYSYRMWTIHLFRGVCRTSWCLRFHFPCLPFFIIHTPFMSFFPGLTCVNLSWNRSFASLGAVVCDHQLIKLLVVLSRSFFFKSKTYGHARSYGSVLYFSSFIILFLTVNAKKKKAMANIYSNLSICIKGFDIRISRKNSQ